MCLQINITLLRQAVVPCAADTVSYRMSTFQHSNVKAAKQIVDLSSFYYGDKRFVPDSDDILVTF